MWQLTVSTSDSVQWDVPGGLAAHGLNELDGCFFPKSRFPWVQVKSSEEGGSEPPQLLLELNLGKERERENPPELSV